MSECPKDEKTPKAKPIEYQRIIEVVVVLDDVGLPVNAVHVADRLGMDVAKLTASKAWARALKDVEVEA